METRQTTRNQIAAADVMSLLSIAGLVLLSGVLITLYTVLVHQFAVRTSSEDSVKQAAMHVAQDLRQLVVEDASFGPIGLCDTNIGTPENRRHITSLNRLYATLRLDNIVSKHVEAPIITALVETDFRRLKMLEKKLRDRITKRVAISSNSESIFESAYKLASGGRKTDEELVDLQIKLGSLNSADLNSGMPVTESADEQGISSKGFYLANVDIPITESGTARFYQIANETRFVNNPEFVPAKPDMIPTAVLVEATFKSSKRNQHIDVVRTRSAVVVLGGVDASTPNSVLMVSFPQGMPSAFHSIRALVSGATEKTGAWQEAAGGNVPGQGHLAAAHGLDSTEMNGRDAVQTAFYHWMRSMGPKPRATGLERVFNYSWSSLPVRSEEGEDQPKLSKAPNSALIKDTGARAFAVFYQSGPGAVGQAVLKNAFEANSSASSIPHSAIPLNIDEHGNCNVAGRTGFDHKLIADLLESVYETNLVANESISVAKSIVSRLERAEQLASSTIRLAQEELTSVANRRARLEVPGEPSSELKALRKSEQEMLAAITFQKSKRSEYQRVKERANIVLMNAESASQASFDVCSNMLRYAQGGVFRCENNRAFLLSNEYIFRPLSRSVTEDEIYKDLTASDAPWLADRNVLEPAPNDLVAEGMTVAERRAAQSSNRAMPRFIILESRALLSEDPQAFVLSRSPFSDSGIPAGQLGYYAQDALTTGRDPQVGWSLLVRDAVANASKGSEPLSSTQNKWCLNEERAVSVCPGLAVEIQVRSPLPIIPDLPVGSFVVNPLSHERVSQIPPVPATML